MNVVNLRISYFPSFRCFDQSLTDHPLKVTLSPGLNDFSSFAPGFTLAITSRQICRRFRLERSSGLSLPPGQCLPYIDPGFHEQT